MKSTRPLQRLSYSEKIANKKEWGKENIDYYITTSTFGGIGTSSGRDIQALYDIYNNRLPESWFYFVKNPLNSTKSEFSNFPARIREYTIIRPNIDLFHGEYSKRPSSRTVINAAHEAWNTFMDEKKKAVETNLRQHFINYVNAAGVDTGEETQEVPMPAELEAKFLSSYKDNRAIVGQKALRVIEEENSVRELHKDLFKDWLIAGECYTYKDVRLSDIDYERVSPLELDYDKSVNSKYIEDGEWVTRRFEVTISDFIDKFYDTDDKEVLEEIDNREGSVSSTKNHVLYSRFTRNNTQNREDTRNKIEVIHVVWKSERKIGFLTYPDPLTGEQQEVEVDEDYKVDKSLGESVDWRWVTEGWEGYRVDGDKYLGIRRLPIQRNKMNRFSYCKLPYNGVRFSDLHSTNISPLELGIPFQIMHIILKYRMELTIAKSKGKIVLIDQNVIPKKNEWDEEKFFYYAEATGWGFIDRNQIGVDKGYNQYQVLDLTLFEHIEQVLKLIQVNKAEWDEVLGINPYRKGQTQASDAVSNVQQGIFQSSVISEMLFDKFESFINTEYKGLLDVSKFAWVDGKKKVYRSDESRTEILNVEPADYIESELDIFVTNTAKEIENLNALKSHAQAFVQNKGKASLIAEIISAENFAELKQKINNLEAMEQKLAESMEENKANAEKEKMAIAQQYEEIKKSFEIEKENNKAANELEKLEREYDRKEQIEYIKGDVAIHTFQGSSDVNANGIPDINEIEKRAVEREKMYSEGINKQTELNLRAKELGLKEKEINTKERTEKYKSDTQLQIAKENKNKHDKK